MNESKVRKEIITMMKNLPIFCRVCGEELTLSDSQNMTWGCSCHDNIDTHGGPLIMKEGRHIADKHYSDSRTYMSFDQEKSYQMVHGYLSKILNLIDER